VRENCHAGHAQSRVDRCGVVVVEGENPLKESGTMTFVHYGCGHDAPDGWMNFDASLTLKAERLPILGKMIKKNSHRFPKNVTFGDIVSGLPIAAASVDAVYASHVLEHLSRDGMITALRNTLSILRPGGIFRLVVPDLEARARRYVDDLSSRSDANDRFLKSSYLGVETDQRGIAQLASGLFSRSKHLWMWDYPSMKAALESVGFISVRRCDLGDSGLQEFDAVERRDRFHDEVLNIRELAMHCQKPKSSQC
jgi:SAM-dependent methyltransferase